jgi:hypothetical protein
MNTRTTLEAALAAVRHAGERIAIAKAGLERISVTTDDSAARQLAALDAKEDAEFSAYARGELVEMPKSADRTDIKVRVAQATAQREQVDRVRSKLQNDLSHAMADKRYAEASLPLIAMQIAVDEQMPHLIEVSLDAFRHAARATACLRAFRSEMLAQCYTVPEASRRDALLIYAQTDAINAIKPNELYDIDALESEARKDVAATLAERVRS